MKCEHAQFHVVSCCFMMERRLIVAVRKDDTQIREAFQIFSVFSLWLLLQCCDDRFEIVKIILQFFQPTKDLSTFITI